MSCWVSFNGVCVSMAQLSVEYHPVALRMSVTREANGKRINGKHLKAATLKAICSCKHSSLRLAFHLHPWLEATDSRGRRVFEFEPAPSITNTSLFKMLLHPLQPLRDPADQSLHLHQLHQSLYHPFLRLCRCSSPAKRSRTKCCW
jgi:hypothetical protein